MLFLPCAKTVSTLQCMGSSIHTKTDTASEKLTPRRKGTICFYDFHNARVQIQLYSMPKVDKFSEVLTGAMAKAQLLVTSLCFLEL